MPLITCVGASRARVAVDLAVDDEREPARVARARRCSRRRPPPSAMLPALGARAMRASVGRRRRLGGNAPDADGAVAPQRPSGRCARSSVTTREAPQRARGRGGAQARSPRDGEHAPRRCRARASSAATARQHPSAPQRGKQHEAAGERAGDRAGGVRTRRRARSRGRRRAAPARERDEHRELAARTTNAAGNTTTTRDQRPADDEAAKPSQAERAEHERQGARRGRRARRAAPCTAPRAAQIDARSRERRRARACRARRRARRRRRCRGARPRG